MFREAKYSSLLWSMTVARNKISISLYLDVIVNIKFSLCQMWLVASMKFMTLSAHVMLVVNSSGPSSGLSSELNIFISLHYTGGGSTATIGPHMSTTEHKLSMSCSNTWWPSLHTQSLCSPPVSQHWYSPQHFICSQLFYFSKQSFGF